MNARLLRRADEIARNAQQRRMKAVAERLGELLRGASISLEEARVTVSGRGLLKRWLSDPGLRFFGGFE